MRKSAARQPGAQECGKAVGCACIRQSFRVRKSAASDRVCMYTAKLPRIQEARRPHEYVSAKKASIMRSGLCMRSFVFMKLACRHIVGISSAHVCTAYSVD